MRFAELQGLVGSEGGLGLDCVAAVRRVVWEVLGCLTAPTRIFYTPTRGRLGMAPSCLVTGLHSGTSGGALCPIRTDGPA